MKKTICAILALLILVSGTLTGCTGSEPFDKEFVISASSVYGVKVLADDANATSAVRSFSNKNAPSAYYVSKSKEEAQILYTQYINKNNYNPGAVVQEIVVVAVKETVVTAIYETDCCVLYFEDKSEAKAYFDSYTEMIKWEHRTNKTGKMDGYSYAISYTLTANRDGNCDWLKGVYQKGNSVLIISGFSPIGIQDTYSDYIYNKLGVIDPATLNT